jgi:LysR family transcriptional regulator, hydrogen peroxide-inducible genes activator
VTLARCAAGPLVGGAQPGVLLIMLEMHEIRYFLALARELHFTRAAEACAVTQPAFTRAIRKLEVKLGGLLFNRRRGQIDLTALGWDVLPRLQAGFEEIEAVHSQARYDIKAKRTRIRLGVTCTISPDIFAPILKDLDQELNNVEIVLKEAKSGTIVELLASGDIDIGIAAWPVYPDDMDVHPIFIENYAIAFAAGHVFQDLDEVPLAQLSGETYLERLHCEFDDHFKAATHDWNINTEIRFSSEREDWIQSMVRQGLGVSIVPEFMPLADGIESRAIVEPSVQRVVAVLTLRGQAFSRVQQHLVRKLLALGLPLPAPVLASGIG